MERYIEKEGSRVGNSLSKIAECLTSIITRFSCSIVWLLRVSDVLGEGCEAEAMR